MLLYLQFRYVSFRFSPVRYLRFCFRVLTASRLISRKRERSLVRHGMLLHAERRCGNSDFGLPAYPTGVSQET